MAANQSKSEQKRVREQQAPEEPTQAVTTVLGGAVPAYLAGKVGQPARGTENVTQDDLVLPRIELVQSLSPCLDEKDPAYIEDSKVGHMYNSVTRQLFKGPVFFIPVYFRKEWVLWKDRKKGGGFFGSFPTPEEADAYRLEELPERGENPEDVTILDTPVFMVMYSEDEEGPWYPAALTLAKSKAKIARQLNSMIMMADIDSFAQRYLLGTTGAVNKQGDKYQTYTVQRRGFAPEIAYRKGEELYNKVKEGKVSVDQSHEDGGEGGTADVDVSGTTEY